MHPEFFFLFSLRIIPSGVVVNKQYCHVLPSVIATIEMGSYRQVLFGSDGGPVVVDPSAKVCGFPKEDSASMPQDAIETLEKHPFNRPKSTWEPPLGKCGALESYIDAVEEEIECILSKPNLTRDNLNKEERSALQTLKNRVDIVIKKADKGYTVVVMDRDKYLTDAHRQLSDECFYKKL
jgi:hypothetical protein